MNKRQREGLSLTKPGRPVVQLTPLRCRAHQQMDQMCNDILRRGEQIQSIAVVVVSSERGQTKRVGWHWVGQDSYAMAHALDLAAFKLKLDAYTPDESDDD